MVSSLIYVSQSLLRPEDEAAEIASILSVAMGRNQRLGVTGALLFTHARFAQVLEGPPASLDELMVSIQRDPRHRDVEVVLTERLTARRFPDWSLAYSGPSAYIDRHIKALLQCDMAESDMHTRATSLLGMVMQLVGASTTL